MLIFFSVSKHDIADVRFVQSYSYDQRILLTKHMPFLKWSYKNIKSAQSDTKSLKMERVI